MSSVNKTNSGLKFRPKIKLFSMLKPLNSYKELRSNENEVFHSQS
jgi:hypothetical protein